MSADPFDLDFDAEKWTPRTDAFTVLVVVSAEAEMADYREFHQWMDRLRAVIGSNAPSPNEDEAWTVSGWSPNLQYGRWTTDKWGHKTFDKRPHCNVWQRIEGDVASVAMAYVWAAIHLVDPIERAGFTIQEMWAGLTDEMVVLA